MKDYPWKRLLCVLFTAILAGSIFCFWIYPLIAAKTFVPFDIDQHGSLGEGLYAYGTFSYYPSTEPIIDRGPIYPSLVAAVISISHAHWHAGIQLLHIALFAFTCGLVFEIIRRLSTPQRAFIGGMVCALYPYLIWFLPRVYIEPLSFCLATLLAFFLLFFDSISNNWRWIVLGVFLGILSLTKQTFLPFLLIVPAYLFWTKKLSSFQSIGVILLAIAVISPWTYRNWNLTGKFIPVQGLFGYNLAIGDGLFEYFWTTPLNELWEKSYNNNLKGTYEEVEQSLGNLSPKWEREVLLEEKLTHKSLERYIQNPSFFLHKILFNGWSFWVLGTNTKLWYALIVLQGSMILLFLFTSFVWYTKFGWKDVKTFPITLTWLYFLIHVPVIGGARFSTAVIPIIISYIASTTFIFRPKTDKSG